MSEIAQLIGIVERWNDGIVECWNNRTMEYCNVGMLEYWNVGQSIFICTESYFSICLFVVSSGEILSIINVLPIHMLLSRI